MIYIKIDNDVFYDDAVVLVRSFYPRTEVMALKADSKPEEKDEILSIEVPDVTGLDKKNAHEVFKDSLYKKLSEKTCKKLPWGYLTGVRPSKIAYTMLEEGATKEQITYAYHIPHASQSIPFIKTHSPQRTSAFSQSSHQFSQHSF